MSYIWNHPNWPSFRYDDELINTSITDYELQKKATDILFSIIDSDTKNRMYAASLTDEIVSSLEIEGEKISYNSVYASICNSLGITTETKTKSNQYVKDISNLVLDATGNLEKLSSARIKEWHSLLFSSIAGIKPKRIAEYRGYPVYIIKANGKGGEVIYEGLPSQKIGEDMEKLINYINGKNEQHPQIKSAIASLWFLCIHPFEDGNGRISRAIAENVISCGTKETHIVSSISSLILKNRSNYYHLLNKISSQSTSLDITSWLNWNIEMGKEAINMYEKSVTLTQFMKRLDPSIYNSRQLSMLRKLGDGSFRGKLSTDKWAKINKCSSTDASRDIRQLLKVGFLLPSRESRPQTGYFLNPDLIQ